MYGGGGYDGGGASQFAGGGFMPSQGAAGGPGSAKKDYSKSNQSLRAFTIKQLHDGTAALHDDAAVIDGKEVANNDAGDDASRARLAEIQPGGYVRAHGHFQSFNSERSMVAFNVTYHFLQAIFQHVHHTKGTGAPAGGYAAPAAGGGYGAAPAAGYGAAPAAGGGGLTAVQQEVMAVFSAPDALTDTGLSINDVQARLGGRLSYPTVRDAVEMLMNQGHIYSTIDESHFRACA
eukprot:scaffold8.g1438.t1